MTLFDRYLSGEFAQAVFAALVVLLMVSLGGIAADILGEIAGGRVPASMLLTQLGLRLVRYLPMILPLALLLGLMLAAGRLYRDSEMPVLISLGIGPKRMLVPLMLVVAPVVGFIAACSLWLGPMADRMAQTMIQQANRNLLIAGLEPGKFTELPGGGVVYVGAMSGDGTALQRVFVYRQNEERLDVTTARAGQMRVESGGERFLTLAEGFRVEGPLHAGKNYRLMRYASNELQLPEGERAISSDDPELLPTTRLLGDPRPQAASQLHARIAPPLLALAFALLALPLARSSPRQPRYGRVLLGFLAYLFGTMLMLLGTDWLAAGKVPQALGLWWLLLPLLALGGWMYFNDGKPRGARPAIRKRVGKNA